MSAVREVAAVVDRRNRNVVQEVRKLADRIASSLDLEIVDLDIRRSSRGSLLRLDIDREGPSGIGLEDCQRVSRALEAALDEQEPFDHSYILEVSSPGLDREIRTEDDFRRNTGRKIAVEIEDPERGSYRLTGVLLDRSAGSLRLRKDDEQEVRVPRERVIRAYPHVPF